MEVVKIGVKTKLESRKEMDLKTAKGVNRNGGEVVNEKVVGEAAEKSVAEGDSDWEVKTAGAPRGVAKWGKTRKDACAGNADGTHAACACRGNHLPYTDLVAWHLAVYFATLNVIYHSVGLVPRGSASSYSSLAGAMGDNPFLGPGAAGPSLPDGSPSHFQATGNFDPEDEKRLLDATAAFFEDIVRRPNSFDSLATIARSLGVDQLEAEHYYNLNCDYFEVTCNLAEKAGPFLRAYHSSTPPPLVLQCMSRLSSAKSVSRDTAICRRGVVRPDSPGFPRGAARPDPVEVWLNLPKHAAATFKTSDTWRWVSKDRHTREHQGPMQAADHQAVVQARHCTRWQWTDGRR
ncbi:uncharacterized protein BXZ73DRAFT_81851 [Epithele typhae]|uniref:uncharacterized protein n=1 Tax=Epithele typhae TaxID=378194 RepID=UPI0020087F3B|nr:uncharacterized protein BXZ73DRAFT_81851 [Epithele typhae]KAH9913669.1 hypothetical protein BXZ73DRAFT_81851 [Epithele typhae]